ncbi:MAG: helix-turn-helix domain-containing protein [Acidiferrobacterales bacterium]
MSRHLFKMLRRSIGLSQTKLAREMGVTLRTVSRWERGNFPIPRLAELALKAIFKEANEKSKN